MTKGLSGDSEEGMIIGLSAGMRGSVVVNRRKGVKRPEVRVS